MTEVLHKISPSETSAAVTTDADGLWEYLRRWVDAPATNEWMIDASWRERRHENRREERQFRQEHRKHYLEMLEQRRQSNRSASVPDLLRQLAGDWGMTWTDVARMVGVSVPALRKWRVAGGGASPENHDRLALLVAFLAVLQELGVSQPVAWIQLPLVEGYSATPRHLYGSLDSASALVDFAAGNVSAVELLDELQPDWRSVYKSDFEVYIAEDGVPSLRTRATTD